MRKWHYAHARDEIKADVFETGIPKATKIKIIVPETVIGCNWLQITVTSVRQLFSFTNNHY